MVLSEYEQQFLDDRDVFYWKGKAQYWQGETERWRKQYHQLAVRVTQIDDDGYTDANDCEELLTSEERLALQGQLSLQGFC